MSTFLCGSYGRIRVGPDSTTRNIVAGIKKWTYKEDGDEVETTNFESPTDANGVIHGEYIPGCTVNATVDVEGIIDHTLVSGTLYTLAPQVPTLLDLIFNKSTPNLGFSVTAFMKSRTIGVMVKEGQTFNATYRVTGIPTAIASIVP